MHVPGEKAPFSSGLFPTWPHNSFLTDCSRRRRRRCVYLFQLLNSRLIFTLWAHLTPIVCRNTWQIAARPAVHVRRFNYPPFFRECLPNNRKRSAFACFWSRKNVSWICPPKSCTILFQFPATLATTTTSSWPTRIVCFENELNLKLHFAFISIFTPLNAVVCIRACTASIFRDKLYAIDSIWRSVWTDGPT